MNLKMTMVAGCSHSNLHGADIVFGTIRKFYARKWRRKSVITVIAVAAFSEAEFFYNKIFLHSGED